MTDYNTEARRWQIDVDAEAARLIQLGVPPWDAIIQARQRISARRRDAAMRPPTPPVERP